MSSKKIIEEDEQENTYIKEDEESDNESESDDDDDDDDESDDEAEETEGFKMPNIFESLGLGDFGGMLTMVIIIIVLIIVFSQFMEVDLFDMPSFFGSSNSAPLLDGEVAVE